MTTGETARQSAHGDGRDGGLRAQILQAAERIFVAEGYEEATVERIAEALGVSLAAVELHFPDKAAILWEISRHAVIEQVERNRQIAALPIDAGARLRLMVEGYMDWVFAHPDAYQLVFSPSHAVSALLNEATADLSARCYEICAGVVRELAAAGRLRCGTADCAMQLLWASGCEVVALVRCLPVFKWASRDELMTVTADGLVAGLLAD
jgi:AcrR family transcriptional regulator